MLEASRHVSKALITGSKLITRSRKWSISNTEMTTSDGVSSHLDRKLGNNGTAWFNKQLNKYIKTKKALAMR